ncbi:UNVERIFIED_CONTAM: protein NRT1/ PTR FAMILY 7.3 [Sesamum radiatum]|uniref:Protein NRT1/ PTR FAMILY 7.3 n=1 Tax=Sesamum radiatum TaxID=300843 RepID=A0AAW2VKR8_SESRA
MQERGTGLLDTCTKDGAIDMYRKPAAKEKTGGWRSGFLLLVKCRCSKNIYMDGTLNICTLLGAFLSDSYLGRYLTCVVFQVVLVIGLVLLSVSTQEFMLEPKGCGKIGEMCNQPSPAKLASFYVSVYLLALGSGAIEPALATLGADQFDEEDSEENKSKTKFFSYYYVALNLGSLIAETVLVYIENLGKWVLAFWISTFCGFLALIFLLSGTSRYRHTRPSGNPISRFCQVIVACLRKLKMDLPSHGDGLYEVHGKDEKECAQRILHTDDFKCLDRAAVMTPSDKILLSAKGNLQIRGILYSYAKAFIYVAQWEFFASQIPDRLKSLGIGLSMSSSALGSYLCTIILTLVMKVTSKHGKPGWIPPNLNEGHLDRFFFLSAALIAFDLVLFITCANRFKCIEIEKRDDGKETFALTNEDNDSPYLICSFWE